ncbi:pyridoxamine 5'-phosphate oxidase family protein [Actinoalloteichus spitiensis]|uniref:pyridoxamine 5'-phosphate oxidase family protein n=1 Tax=Actinoalloteichus spitiensis TaxID=252394 RepID=UPI00035E3D6B|nr:pyridoxamine 5'-phosphate oxidase family protein [Actinoalloteichus spitiensis]
MTTQPLSPTARSTVRRGRRRSVADRETLYSILDVGLVCQLSLVLDGSPVVLPTCYGRVADTLYLHGSTGAASLRALAGGAEACVAVTLLDGVVYARSVFHHSVNYRSAVIHGTPVLVEDPVTKLEGLRAVTERLAPGSWEHARSPTPRELAATAVLALDLTEAAVKVRAAPPGDDEEDVAAGSRWAGVLPLHQRWGDPEPCPLLPEGSEVPAHVRGRGGQPLG